MGYSQTAGLNFDVYGWLRKSIIARPLNLLKSNCSLTRRLTQGWVRCICLSSEGLQDSRQENLDPASNQKRLRELARFTVRQLEDATNILSSLICITLKMEKWLELSNSILKQIYPIISQYNFSYQWQKDSLPEKSDHRELPITSINVIHQSTIS